MGWNIVYGWKSHLHYNWWMFHCVQFDLSMRSIYWWVPGGLECSLFLGIWGLAKIRLLMILIDVFTWFFWKFVFFSYFLKSEFFRCTLRFYFPMWAVTYAIFTCFLNFSGLHRNHLKNPWFSSELWLHGYSANDAIFKAILTIWFLKFFLKSRTFSESLFTAQRWSEESDDAQKCRVKMGRT